MFLACGLLVCTAFHFILDSDFPQRLRDHRMVMEQMVANCTLLMAFVLWAPHVGAALMMLSFMPTTEREDAALAAAERVREPVSRVEWVGIDAGLDVTVSNGLSVARPGESVEALLGRADTALYTAKHDGRNCVRAA